MSEFSVQGLGVTAAVVVSLFTRQQLIVLYGQCLLTPGIEAHGAVPS